MSNRIWQFYSDLFGSRARGDHDDLKSDIDILLVQESEPDADHKRLAIREAAVIAKEAYGRVVPVELVWRTRDRFRFNRRYVNSIETNAVHDGVLMPLDPERFIPSEYEDAESEYEYDWSNYRERIRHAETHLDEFTFMAESNRSDLVIGQQARNALEHGMKALIAAAADDTRILTTSANSWATSATSTRKCAISGWLFRPTCTQSTKAGQSTANDNSRS